MYSTCVPTVSGATLCRFESIFMLYDVLFHCDRKAPQSERMSNRCIFSLKLSSLAFFIAKREWTFDVLTVCVTTALACRILFHFYFILSHYEDFHTNVHKSTLICAQGNGFHGALRDIFSTVHN